MDHPVMAIITGGGRWVHYCCGFEMVPRPLTRWLSISHHKSTLKRLPASPSVWKRFYKLGKIKDEHLRTLNVSYKLFCGFHISWKNYIISFLCHKTNDLVLFLKMVDI